MKKLLKGYGSTDGKVTLALLYAAVMLTVLERWFLTTTIEQRLRGMTLDLPVAPSLDAGVIWSAACTVCYLVIPLFIVLVVHRQSPRTIGYSFSGFRFHVLIYLALYAVMLPLILYAAEDPAFLRVYPFVPEAKRNMESFVRWEIAYVIQFIALESFFRGYLLFTLEKKMGWHAIYVMAIPYCMIHVHKPPLEQLGAIVAGVALGGLALRFRSWYGGALLHSLVAVTMDGLAASAAGLF